MLSFAIPNDIFLLGSPIIAFFAIIPYFLAFRNCKSYKMAFLLGFIQAITTHLVSSYWLAFFKDFALFTLGASAVGTSFFAGYTAVFAYLAFSRDDKNNILDLQIFSAKQPFYTTSWFRVLFFSGMYTIYEYIKSSGFLGYPWGTVSSAMFNFPILMQLSALTGTYGITFLTVMFNCLLVEFFVTKKYAFHSEIKSKLWCDFGQVTLVFTSFFILAMIYGTYQYNKPRNPVKQLTTIFVQQNEDPWKLSTDDSTVILSQELTQKVIDELAEENKKPQLIVWSEGSLKKYFPGNYGYYKYNPEEKPLVDFIKKNKTPLLSGGGISAKTYTEIDGEQVLTRKLFNAALMFDEKGNYVGYYGKLHLVPFAESIPGIDNPVIKKIIMKAVGISAGWHQGEHLTYFDIPCTMLNEDYSTLVQNYDLSQKYVSPENKKPLVKISTPICFDDAFTDVFRPMFLNGTELFVNITDDSWSLRKSSEYQHFCIAAYRAIEYRTTLLRSCNAGYSVVLDPAGKILTDQPLFEACAKAYDIPVYEREMTMYARLGNWLPYTLLFLYLIFSVLMQQSFVKTDYIESERKLR
ncbi:MAG: apolipoprotein N-acyltransferase [Treponema sp.]|nr:apolipoprotein N-acyltransferase [Treponema sp.]